MYKKGFTLAEVLITLGVIGVVSAMTLGSIIHNYKVYVAKNQFKKVYATLSNGINLSLQEFGENANCYYISDGGASRGDCKDFFENYLYKNIKVAKICKGNAFEQGCVPDYKETILKNYGGCEGFSANNLKKWARVVLLNDGSIIFPYYYNSIYYPIIGIDINGHKGPNIPGIDIFSLKIMKYNNSIPNLQKGGNVAKACLNSSSKKYFSTFNEINK